MRKRDKYLTIHNWFHHMCLGPSVPLELGMAGLDINRLVFFDRAVAQLNSCVNFRVKVYTSAFSELWAKSQVPVPQISDFPGFPDRWRHLHVEVNHDVSGISHALQELSPCLHHIVQIEAGASRWVAPNSLPDTIEGMHLIGPTKIALATIHWKLLRLFTNLCLLHTIRSLTLHCSEYDAPEGFFSSLQLLSDLPCMEELEILIESSESPQEPYAPVNVAKLRSLTVKGRLDNIVLCLGIFRGTPISDLCLRVSYLSSGDASKEVVQVLHNALPQIKHLALSFPDTVRSLLKANE